MADCMCEGLQVQDVPSSLTRVGRGLGVLGGLLGALRCVGGGFSGGLGEGGLDGRLAWWWLIW